MLRRSDPSAELRRRTDAERKKRYRDRRRRGVACPKGVEVSAVGLDFLIATGWLREEDAADPIAIGDAISRMIEDSGANKAGRVDIGRSGRMP
jgi:hypothetical protein